MRAKNQAYAIAAVLACAGSALGQTSWNNPAGGNWNLAANWSPTDIPNTLVESALLGNLGAPYTVQGDLTTTILGMALHSSVTLNINAGRTLSLGSDDIANAGVIIINDSGSPSNASLRADADFSIIGSGRVELNALSADLGDAAIEGALGAQITIGANQTVHGSGLVRGPVAVRGLIESDRAGRDIALTDDIDLSGGGTIRGIGGGTVALQGNIVGGSIDGGVQSQFSSGTIDGSTSTQTNGLRPGSTLGLLASGLTNNGTWIVNTDASTSNATMRAHEDATIDGTGTIELNSVSGDLGDAEIGGSATLTLGAGQEVRGSGTVDGPLTLLGTINADRDARDIAVTGAVDASGGGTLTGSNSGAVALQGQLVGGTLAGAVEAQFSATTINGSTSTGTNGVRPGATMTLVGNGLTNNGTVVVNTAASSSNASLVAGESTVIDGDGNIELNSISGDLGDAQIDSISGPILTIAAQQSINGSGAVNGSFILDGTINADRDGRDIAVSGDLDLTGGGTLVGTNNGRVALQAAITGGTLAGGVESQFSTSSVSGVTAINDNGVRPGAVLSVLSGGFTNNGIFTVNTGASSANAHIRVIESATIDGSGVIDLNATGGDLGDASLDIAEAVTLTIGADQAITGSGAVTGVGVVEGVIDCAGTIHADRLARDLRVDAAVDLAGGGTMQGTNGGRVAVHGAVTGGQWLGGVEAEFAAASVSGVTMSGVNGVRAGAVLTLDAAGFTNDGTFIVNTNGSSADAVVNAAESCTIDGSGEVRLNAASGDFGDAELRAIDPAVITIGSQQTLAGRGRLSADILMDGTLAPGEPADETQEIQITGQTTLAEDSTTGIGIAGLADTDRLTGTGALTLGGTLELTLLDGFVPNFEDEFLIVDVGATAGDFDTVDTPIIGLGLFRVVIGPDTVKAVWTCQADLNGDGILDFFDVQFFLNAFAEQALYGDYNEDGFNDFFDVQAFLNDFSAGCL